MREEDGSEEEGEGQSLMPPSAPPVACNRCPGSTKAAKTIAWRETHDEAE